MGTEGTVQPYSTNPISGDVSYRPAMESTLEEASNTTPLPVTDHTPSAASIVYKYTCVALGARVSATHKAVEFSNTNVQIMGTLAGGSPATLKLSNPGSSAASAPSPSTKGNAVGFTRRMPM